MDFLSGGALGFDQMAAEIVLSLREKYPWVRLIMVIPYDGQAGGTAGTVDYARCHGVRVLRLPPVKASMRNVG